MIEALYNGKFAKERERERQTKVFDILFEQIKALIENTPETEWFELEDKFPNHCGIGKSSFKLDSQRINYQYIYINVLSGLAPELDLYWKFMVEDNQLISVEEWKESLLQQGKEELIKDWDQEGF